MSTTRTILKNALANGAGLVCEAVIAFCMLPFILHRLGESAYGVWVFTIAISGYMGILNLGFRPAVNKYVAQYRVSGDWEKIRDLLQASLFSYSFCGSIILLVCTLLSLKLNTLFNIPPEFQNIASILVLLVGIQMSCGLLAVVFGGVISGLQRYEINNGIEICVMLGRTAIILLFLDKHPSLAVLAIAHFSMTILGYLATVIFACRIADILPLKLFRRPDREAITLIFKFSVITFVISSVGRIIMYLDTPLIAAVLTTSTVTYYAIGSRLIKYLRSFIEVLMNVMMPAISDLEARGRLDTVQSLFTWSSKISALITFPVLAFLVVFGNDFFLLWLGKSYPESYHVMLALIVAAFVYNPQINTFSILFGTARHKILMYLSICSGVLSILLAIILGRNYGLIGMAIGLSWPQAFIFGLICPVYVAGLLKMSWWNWFLETFGRSLLANLPFVLFLYTVKYFWSIDTWYLFLGIAIAASIIYLLLIWLLGFTIRDRKQFKNTAMKLKGKLPLSL